MNKIMNHGIGAALSAVTLLAVVATGCATPEDECDDADSMAPMMIVDEMAGKVGGGSGGRGGSSGGGSRGGGGKVSVNKPGTTVKKPVTGSGGTTGGTGSKPKAPKIKHDDSDCDED